MIRAVLFDLDGTLADTAPDLGYALNLQLQRHGRAPLPAAVIRPHVSGGARGLLRLGFGLGSDDPGFASMREEYLALYDQHLARDTALFPGVAELLATLEARRIPWGIVTNKPQRFTVPVINALGLARRAACVVSGDSVPRPKPHPDSLLKAAADLGLEPAAALYVGDDERDIQAGRAAGMRVVVAAYGYLGTGSHYDQWGADTSIPGPLELLQFL